MQGLNLHAAAAVGGVNETTQLRPVRQSVQIVIATPGRLCDFLDRKLIELGNVGLLVVDEADRMLDMA